AQQDDGGRGAAPGTGAHPPHSRSPKSSGVRQVPKSNPVAEAGRSSSVTLREAGCGGFFPRGTMPGSRRPRRSEEKGRDPGRSCARPSRDRRKETAMRAAVLYEPNTPLQIVALEQQGPQAGEGGLGGEAA